MLKRYRKLGRLQFSFLEYFQIENFCFEFYKNHLPDFTSLTLHNATKTIAYCIKKFSH